MKMSNDEFLRLTKAIKELKEKHGEQKLRDFRENVAYKNNQFIAFVWGVFRAIPEWYNEYCSIWYEMGLDDNHIETALKKALSEYK